MSMNLTLPAREKQLSGLLSTIFFLLTIRLFVFKFFFVRVVLETVSTSLYVAYRNETGCYDIRTIQNKQYRVNRL